MKTQLLSLVLITAFLLSLTLVTAVSFTASTPTTLTKVANTTTFTITALTNGTATLPSIVSLGNITVSVSPTTITLNTSAPTTTITLTTTAFPSDMKTYTGSILVYNSANASDNQTIAVSYNKGLCSVLTKGQLTIDSMEINVKDGFGEDDDYLYPLDKVEASFNIENSGDWDIKNIEITACLLDKTTGKCIMDEGDMDITNDDLDLDSDDDDDVTLTFDIDPDTLKVGNNEYTLYVSATGEIDDSDAGTSDNTDTCSSGSEDIEIRTDDTFAVISDISYTENLSCGGILEVSANIWNIGDEDFADDEIYFEIYNKELGIDKEFTFDSGLDSMEKQNIFYSVKLPANLTEKSYKLQLSVLDDDHSVMQNKEDDKSQSIVLVNVANCIAPVYASISASLSDTTPTAKVGGEVIVNAVIKNTGSSSATYTVSVPSVDFAEVSEIDPTTFTLAAGYSQDVAIYLNIDSDAKVGDKEFTIRAVSGQSVSEQKVKLAVQEGFSANGLVNHIKNNWIVYLIILVNIILIIAIIAVVVRIVNKSD